MNAEVSLSHMSGTKHLQGPPWQPVHFFPLLSTLGLLLLGLVVVSYETELIDRPLEAASDLLWRNATVRPPVLIVLILIGWAFVVRTCRETRMNVDQVLGGRLQPPGNTLHAALTLLALVLFAHLVHFAANAFPGLSWRPWLSCNLALHVALGVVGLLP